MTRLRTALLLLLTFTVGIVIAVHAGQAVAYKAPASLTEAHLDTTDRPAEPTGHAGHILELDLPATPQTETGTDAGLITTPAH